MDIVRHAQQHNEHRPQQDGFHLAFQPTEQQDADQKAKNKKRQPAKRWNEAKIERTVNKFTDDFIGNVYDKIYKGMKANRNTSSQEWIDFLETNEILDDLEESVSMIDFGEE